jgi:hypothetical protein
MALFRTSHFTVGGTWIPNIFDGHGNLMGFTVDIVRNLSYYDKIQKSRRTMVRILMFDMCLATVRKKVLNFS